MITAHEVNAATFEKAMRGYRTDAVDQLLDTVAAQLESDAAEKATLQKLNDELNAKMYVLAQKIEEYQADEDNLKSALINAQRMGENVIREANQKADGVLREATLRADSITRVAKEEIEAEKIELQRVKAEVAQFKSDVLGLYKRHIESLSTLPDEDVEETVLPEQEDVVEPVVEPEVAQVEESAVCLEQTEQVQAGFAATESVEELPTLDAVNLAQAEDAMDTQSVSDEDSFWLQDEAALKENAPQPEQQATMVREAFKGVMFSD